MQVCCCPKECPDKPPDDPNLTADRAVAEEDYGDLFYFADAVMGDESEYEDEEYDDDDEEEEEEEEMDEDEGKVLGDPFRW